MWDGVTKLVTHYGGRRARRRRQPVPGYGVLARREVGRVRVTGAVLGRRRSQRPRRRLRLRAGDRSADAGRWDSTGKAPAAGESEAPGDQRGRPSRRVQLDRHEPLVEADHRLQRGTPTGAIWSTQTTKLVDRKWDKPEEAGGRLLRRRAPQRRRRDRALSEHGRATSSKATPAPNDRRRANAQLYRRDMTGDGAAVLVTAAHDGATLRNRRAARGRAAQPRRHRP